MGGRERHLNECEQRCFRCSETSWRKGTQTSETREPPGAALLQRLTSPLEFFQTWFHSREKATECSTQMHEEMRSYINATHPTCLNTHTHTHITHAAAPTQTSHTGAMTQRGAAGTKARMLAGSSSPSGLVLVFLALQPAA